MPNFSAVGSKMVVSGMSLAPRLPVVAQGMSSFPIARPLHACNDRSRNERGARLEPLLRGHPLAVGRSSDRGALRYARNAAGGGCGGPRLPHPGPDGLRLLARAAVLGGVEAALVAAGCSPRRFA